MSELTQSAKALKLLQRAGKHGVHNYEFPQHRLLRYSQYISDLRDDGYDIIVERQYLPNGRATGVWKYYLVEPKKSGWTKNMWNKITPVKEIE